MDYQRRIIDQSLDELMPGLSAIALDGAKGVGKTATGLQRANTVFDLSVPTQQQVVAGDIGLVSRATEPVFIDEWQLLPEVWGEVKRAVDRDSRGGRFLLAGSATIPPGLRIHSGAGRIVSLKMRPLAITERQISEQTVSLSNLFESPFAELAGQSEILLEQYIDEILASGFPGIRELPQRLQRAQLSSYITHIVSRELSENGVEVRRPDAMRKWLAAYGAATATTSSYSHILDGATVGIADKPARSTVDSYREYLTRLFILEPLAAWQPLVSPIKRITSLPKHHLVDPALAANLMAISKSGLLRGRGPELSHGTWLGALFESLVVQSVRTYADALDARTFHLRTKAERGGASREIDIIIEGEDTRVIAIEVKLSATVTDHDVRHLNWLHDQIGDELADKLIVTTGPSAYRRKDGVGVVPLALLGP